MKGLECSVQDHIRHSDSVPCSVCKYFVVADKQNKLSGSYPSYAYGTKFPFLKTKGLKVSRLKVMHTSHAASRVPTDLDEIWNPNPHLFYCLLTVIIFSLPSLLLYPSFLPISHVPSINLTFTTDAFISGSFHAASCALCLQVRTVVSFNSLQTTDQNIREYEANLMI